MQSSDGASNARYFRHGRCQELYPPRAEAHPQSSALLWPETSPTETGSLDLPEQYEAYPAYQFTLVANEHGRGRPTELLMDDTFQVVWLDCNHELYP